MTDEKSSKLPVTIDVGVKASLEVKAKVPEEVTGRLVTSLTDIIRPFTEARGLRADQIRLQREDVLIEIAKKARLRAELEEIEIRPVPNKMLVPFLEKASVEFDDKEMQDRWAALLLSASKSFQARHLTFVDILSRLSSAELLLLEEVCFSEKSFPETSYPGGHLEKNQLSVQGCASRLVLRSDASTEDSHRAYESFERELVLSYGRLMHASVRSTNTYFYYTPFGSVGDARFASLEILERERLVALDRLQPPGTGVEVGYFTVNHLGIRFVRECAPKASEMAARRPPPIPVNRQTDDKTK
jgi:hypothetical protein